MRPTPLVTLLLALSTLLFTSSALSRDTQHFLSIKEALSTVAAQEKLDGSVKFYFAGERHPAISGRLSEVVANRKTNAFGKTDRTACEWAFLSAMLALQERAQRDGADAVVDITSYYKKNERRSSDTYECHAGAIMAGVALKGRLVRFK